MERKLLEAMLDTYRELEVLYKELFKIGVQLDRIDTIKECITNAFTEIDNDGSIIDFFCWFTEFGDKYSASIELINLIKEKTEEINE